VKILQEVLGGLLFFDSHCIVLSYTLGLHRGILLAFSKAILWHHKLLWYHTIILYCLWFTFLSI